MFKLEDICERKKLAKWLRSCYNHIFRTNGEQTIKPRRNDKMPNETLPQPVDLDASVEEARRAAQYHMQRYGAIEEHGRRGDAKFVALYSLVKYLETFEGEVRGSIAQDQFQELGQQNARVVRTAQGLSRAAKDQDGQKYVAGVAGLIAKAVDTAGVAIKAEAIKTGDYETYRRQVPDEAIAMIQQGVAGFLGDNGKAR